MGSQFFHSPIPHRNTGLAPDNMTDFANVPSPATTTDSSTNSSQGRSSKKKVSSFIQKLFRMLEENTHANLITWNPSGTSFYVYNAKLFAKEVLPAYFKHNNFSSFVRLLNMYGFHKTSKSPRGQRDNDTEIWEFSHTHFIKGRPDLLKEVKRKVLDTELMRREASDMHSLVTRLNMSQTDLQHQLYTLQKNFAQLSYEFEESRKIQRQHEIQIRELTENSTINQKANLTSFPPLPSQQQQQQNMSSAFPNTTSLYDTSIYAPRRTISTPSLTSQPSEQLQQQQMSQIQQQQQQQQQPQPQQQQQQQQQHLQDQEQGMTTDKPFRMLISPAPSSDNTTATTPSTGYSSRSNSAADDRSDSPFWNTTPVMVNANVSPQPEGSSYGMATDFDNTLLQGQIQQFPPLSLQAAVNTPLPPSPLYSASAEHGISPDSSVDSLPSHAFNTVDPNTLGSTFL